MQPAYYTFNGEPRCGRHSEKATRRYLPRNPYAVRAEKQELEVHNASIVDAAVRNQESGVPGQVLLYKLAGAFAAKAPQILGFQSILPNYRTGRSRRDGAIGMPTLSPKNIGPIPHGQPGLPGALNLENFHQGSKKFATQTMEEFRVTQRAMFLDRKPHRHHPEAKKVPKGGNRNIPEFFVWIDAATNEEKHLTYIESRQFYCTFMERELRDLPEYAELVKMRETVGMNILICGFDANPIPEGQTVDDLYLDASRPFGHEIVLYCVLTGQFPWRKHTSFLF
jgi:hypothetical protein